MAKWSTYDVMDAGDIDPAAHYVPILDPTDVGNENKRTLIESLPSGATIQRPTITSSTPLDDFDQPVLDAAWVAHSSGGSFALSDCIPQARDGSRLHMGFQAQMGRIHRPQGNVDLDLRAGGVRPFGNLDGATQGMFGIAALDSSGGGVGLFVYNDGNAYMASIAGWNYGTLRATFVGVGHNLHPGSEYWLRVTRVGNLWSSYLSLGGMRWGAANGAHSESVTVDRIAFGMFYNGANLYTGALEVDWIGV